jgi:hypothetical protein
VVEQEQQRREAKKKHAYEVWGKPIVDSGLTLDFIIVVC